MRIRVVGVGCPVLPGVTVGVQRGRDVEQERPAAGGDLTWELEGRLAGGELRGPYVHGRPGSRFLYLSWQREGTMFRRAKIMVDALPPELLDGGTGLVARLSLTLPDGRPVCAAVRPPAVTWSGG